MAIQLELDNWSWRAYLSSALTNIEEEVKEKYKKFYEKLSKQLMKEFRLRLYLPHKVSDPHHEIILKGDEIYFLDRYRVAESDIIIVNADFGSFGVGQEIELANSLGIPSVIFAQNKEKISRMLLGTPASYIDVGVNPYERVADVIEYGDDIENAFVPIVNRVGNIVAQLKERPLIVDKTNSFPVRLRKICDEKGIDKQNLHQRTGLSLKLINILFSTDIDIEDFLNHHQVRRPDEKITLYETEKFVNPGLWIINLIADALEVPISELVSQQYGFVYSGPQIDQFKNLCDEFNITYKEFDYLSQEYSYSLHREYHRSGVPRKDEFQKKLNNFRENEKKQS